MSCIMCVIQIALLLSDLNMMISVQKASVWKRHGATVVIGPTYYT